MIKRPVTAYDLTRIILASGCRKFQQVKLPNGEYRYYVKNMTPDEWSIYEIGGEDMTDEEKNARCEPGGWVLLDSFTASAVKQVYEHLTETGREKFNRLPFRTLSDLAFRCIK